MDEERKSYPETARSIFDPFVRRQVAEMARQTCEVFAAIQRARENKPRRVTGHETD